jgi:hypothetical protein
VVADVVAGLSKYEIDTYCDKYRLLNAADVWFEPAKPVESAIAVAPLSKVTEARPDPSADKASPVNTKILEVVALGVIVAV